MIVLTGFSQERLTDTLTVRIKYIHQLAATKAFIELRYYKQLDSVNIRLLDFRKSQFEASQHALNYYMEAYKKCDETTVPELNKSIALRDEKFNELKKTLKKEKSKAFGKGFGVGIGTGVVVETAIILLVKFLPLNK